MIKIKIFTIILIIFFQSMATAELSNFEKEKIFLMQKNMN